MPFVFVLRAFPFSEVSACVAFYIVVNILLFVIRFGQRRVSILQVLLVQIQDPPSATESST